MDMEKHARANPFWQAKYSYIFSFGIAFTILTIISALGLTQSIDSHILNFFKSLRSPSMDLFMIATTTISDTINLIIIGFILAIIKRTRRVAMIFLISLVSITIIVTYMKPLLAIDQPNSEFVPLITLPEKFTLEKDSFMPFDQNYSFPSNHLASITAFSFIVSGLAFYKSRHFAIGFVILFPAAIGLTKLYLYQHNLADLISGYFLGLVVITIAVKGLKLDKKTG
jgi:membrane-associated phospholipid phosphatase